MYLANQFYYILESTKLLVHELPCIISVIAHDDTASLCGNRMKISKLSNRYSITLHTKIRLIAGCWQDQFETDVLNDR